MSYLLITISPVIRDIPNIAAKRAGNGAYLAVIISAVMLTVLVFITDKILKIHKGRNIYDIIDLTSGSFAAKLIIFLYALWSLVSAGAYMQHYVRRFSSTIMPYTNPVFFILVMLVLAFFVFRKNFKTISRISEICFPLISGALAILILLALPVINTDNFVLDNIKPKELIKTGADIGSVGGYLILILFLGDRISESQNFKKEALLSGLYFLIITVAIICVTIGINGTNLTARLPLPFFTTVKQISSFGVIERMEPLLISIWLISDFIVISIFTAVFLLCMKWLFGLEKVSFLMIPSLAVIYYFTKLFAGSQFELEYYTMHIMPIVNIVFQYIIPLGILLFSRKINKQNKPASRFN